MRLNLNVRECDYEVIKVLRKTNVLANSADEEFTHTNVHMKINTLNLMFPSVYT